MNFDPPQLPTSFWSFLGFVAFLLFQVYTISQNKVIIKQNEQQLKKQDAAIDNQVEIAQKLDGVAGEQGRVAVNLVVADAKQEEKPPRRGSNMRDAE